ncbi:hypothetical protein [Microbacterium allomyrinae]|uniref:Uncharacterized protein n=1 Tax=Microbacterium allomyrinae TaxID=2830666 RepID=A0A9X1LWJ0_9MICO|nr:hypothetical protein [Microbacterium allomyrinae]MCC2033063.1 hypothetical protein [Microbacterium allomyrinae]
MYSVAGVPLRNPTFGWRFRSPSKPISELVRERANVSAPGTDGTVAGLPATVSAVVLPLVVRTPKAHLQTLTALFSGEGALTVTADASRSVQFELLSWTHVGYGSADSILDVTFIIRLPQVYWRDAAESTSTAASLSTASVAVTGLFPGMSAPVQDAIVRVKGATTGLQVTDTAGSWFTYAPALTGSQYLRFESTTGRAFVTTSDTWVGGTEVSGAVDFGGPRGVFEITPRLAPADPATRDGRLTVATATRSGAQIQVRGTAAFLV